MAQPGIYQTMEELRTRLAVRCGFGAMGSSSVVQNPIFADFLIDAQHQLYHHYICTSTCTVDKALHGPRESLGINIELHSISHNTPASPTATERPCRLCPQTVPRAFARQPAPGPEAGYLPAYPAPGPDPLEWTAP